MKYILKIEKWLDAPDQEHFMNNLEIGDWVMVKPNPSLYDAMNEFTDKNPGQIVGFDKGGKLLAIYVQFLDTPKDMRIRKHLYDNKGHIKSRIYFLNQIIGSGKTPEEAKESCKEYLKQFKNNQELFNMQTKYNL